jgi:hypothetical protein
MTYGLALGDVVETEARDGHAHLVSRVVEPSGRLTMRAWFRDTSVTDKVVERLTAVGACSNGAGTGAGCSPSMRPPRR